MRRRALARSIGVLLIAGCGRFGYDELLGLSSDPRPPSGAGGSADADTAAGAGGDATAGTSAGVGEDAGAGSGGQGRGGQGRGGQGRGGQGGASGSDGSAGSDGNGGSPEGGVPEGGAPDPTPSCSDGLQNQDETGLDCGGASCAPCPCTFGTPELLGDPNFAGNDLLAVSLSSDASTLYIGGIVAGSSRPIGLATRPDRGNTFGFGFTVPAPVTGTPAVEGTPFLSRDGLLLVFYSERPGGAGDRDLYSVTRASTAAQFGSLVRFGNVNSAQRDDAPWLSPDTLTLYYSSRRASPNDDIWLATRGSAGSDFSLPTAVTELNSSGNDTGITISDDGRVAYFASDRAGGLGGMDLYRATRATVADPFSTPERVPDLNTSADDAGPQFTADRQELFFVSTRNGSDSLLFRVASVCP